jgi:hypothetical protein
VTEEIKQNIATEYEDVQSTVNHFKAPLIYITEKDVMDSTHHYRQLLSCNYGI